MRLFSKLFSSRKEPAQQPPAAKPGPAQTSRSSAQAPRVKPFLYSLLALLVFGGSIWVGNRLQSETRLYEINIYGAELTSAAHVLATTGLEQDMLIDSVKVLRVLEQVEALPEVQHARLEFPAPYVIRLHITERTPVGMLVNGDDLSLVGREGVVMPLPGHLHPDVPLIHGFEALAPGDTLKSEAFAEMKAFLDALEHSAIAGATISELGWHADQGIFGLSHEHSVRLVFGREEFGRRLKKWEHFYGKVASQRGMGAFLSLDFRFKDQIVAREQDVRSS